MKLNRGDIVIANLESVSKGSIQKYTRPYIIISNNKANQYSPVVTAVAMSTKTWKKKLSLIISWMKLQELLYLSKN
jgi:mRNA interferase MazF